MKRLLLYMIILMCLFVLFSCNKKVDTLESSILSFNVTPDLNYDSTNARQLIKEKYDNDSLLDARFYDIKEEPLIKVSPANIESVFDIQIFNYDATGQSYLIYDNRAFQLTYQKPNNTAFEYYINTKNLYKPSYGCYNFVIEGNRDDFVLYILVENVLQVNSEIWINKFESKTKTLYQFDSYSINIIKDGYYDYPLLDIYNENSYGLLTFKVENNEINIYSIITNYQNKSINSNYGKIPYNFDFVIDENKRIDINVKQIEFQTHDDELFYDRETGQIIKGDLYK